MQTPEIPAWESELVWNAFNQRSDGFFLDIGANEPKHASQTWFLEQKGWRGVLVEPQKVLCERLEAQRPNSRVIRAACGPPGHMPEMTLHVAAEPSKSSLVRNLVDAGTSYVGTELAPIKTVDELLLEAGKPKLDFVSIDVEGTQLDVLRGFNLQRWKPALLLIEDHLHNLDVHRFLKQRNYILVKRTGLNNWYTPRDRPLRLSNVFERMRLWKKVWLNTPFRKLRVWNEQRRSRKYPDAYPAP
jgi:FkbM family methyltransferase